MPKSGTQITFIERLGPSCAIGADDYQWILLRVHGPAREGAPNDWDGNRWDPVAYIASDKRALAQAIVAHGLELSTSGKAALERQDERIWRWRRV